MHNLPGIVCFNKYAAFIMRAMLNQSILGNGEHKGITEDRGVSKQLQPWFEQIISKIGICACPAMFHHKKMKVKPILAMRGYKPLK